ncbi:helix-turn-helix transcriptional regulator [Micromonospora auratinigra]|uniref:helix-turn-helix transcriptional regulator n=1 Tax=Micromonospora auratinigra TaxID=261654 RepID=UPI000B819145|nr:helix-turn-helix transcriptional regulator [Micromonospora auratinigra]
MSEPTATTGQDRSGQHDLVARSWALQNKLYRRILSADPADPDAPVRLFAEGFQQIVARLPALERATRSLVYNLTVKAVFDPLRREREPNLHTRMRGIRGHMITNPSDYLSLIAAAHPDTWVAPVRANGIAVDERLLLVPGPPTPDQRPTAWLCRDPDLVMEHCDLWWETQRQAVPIREVPGFIALTERQLEVAALLGQGAKDATIARRLGVSPRTVTYDVARLLDSFGVGTRWEGGMVLGRACPPGLAG